MLKMVGACMILLSTTAFGFRKARAYAERPRQIRQMRGALSLIRTEISFGSRRLDQICEQIGHREKEPVRSLYTRCAQYLREMDGVSTFECWKRAVEETWPATELKQPEKEVIIDFGKTWGSLTGRTNSPIWPGHRPIWKWRKAGQGRNRSVTRRCAKAWGSWGEH